MWREDVKLPDGSIRRRQRNLRLETVAELPTKTAAYQALAPHICVSGRTSSELKFSELVERWRATIIPTIKRTTATYYENTLRAHIVRAFREKQISAITRFDVESFLADRGRMCCRNTLRGIARKLKEPYATLILFLAVTGLRIGEAVGIKRSDFDGDILRVGRRTYGVDLSHYH
jgi:integrase